MFRERLGEEAIIKLSLLDLLPPLCYVIVLTVPRSLTPPPPPVIIHDVHYIEHTNLHAYIRLCSAFPQQMHGTSSFTLGTLLIPVSATDGQ